MATALRATPEQFASATKLIERNDEFRTKFDKYSFAFRHKLAGHPVFELNRLLELAQETQTTRPADLYYDAGLLMSTSAGIELPSRNLARGTRFKELSTAVRGSS